MITKQEMEKLGFEKRPLYGKKKRGISKNCWVIYNSFTLTIEREMIPLDESEVYLVPTLRIQNFVFNFTNIEELKKVLIALNLLDSDGDSYDDMTFAELSKIRKERISELKQIDKKMKEMAITIRRSTAGGGNYKF